MTDMHMDSAPSSDAPLQGEGIPDPGLLRRLPMVLLDPGRLGEILRDNPKWFGATTMVGLVTALAVGIVPPEALAEGLQGALAESGAAPPEMFGSIMRSVAIASAFVGAFVATLIGGLTAAVIFLFVLGDEGKFTMHLAAAAHANLVAALGALLLVPVKLLADRPDLNLSVGTFFDPLLPDGKLMTILASLGLFTIAAWVVRGILISRFDRKRTATSAFLILAGVFIAFTTVIALIVPTS